MRNEQQVPWEAGSSLFLDPRSPQTKARFEGLRVKRLKNAPVAINQAKTPAESTREILIGLAEGKLRPHQVRGPF